MSSCKSLALRILSTLSLALGLLAVPAAAQTAAPSPEASAPVAAAGPVAAAAPETPVTTTSKEVIDNPYGLAALWAQGDFVSKGTLIILVIMSMGSWYILITKLYESLKIAGEARAARKGFFKHASLADATK
ncbi:MAG TPA: MotA/TolQ/ExbB proton channel family protein, partial [Albitalea sp.]